MFRSTLVALALLACGTALAEPVGNRVDVNGMKLYYETSGEGEPLIVLHGAYMNIPSMGGIVAKLAIQLRKIALHGLKRWLETVIKNGGLNAKFYIFDSIHAAFNDFTWLTSTSRSACQAS